MRRRRMPMHHIQPVHVTDEVEPDRDRVMIRVKVGPIGDRPRTAAHHGLPCRLGRRQLTAQAKKPILHLLLRDLAQRPRLCGVGVQPTRSEECRPYQRVKGIRELRHSANVEEPVPQWCDARVKRILSEG